MSQRYSVKVRNPFILWLALLLGLALAVTALVIIFLIAPRWQYDLELARANATASARQTATTIANATAVAAATATTAAAQAEIVLLYQAGVAFQEAGQIERAIESFSGVIARAPAYEDAAARLAVLTARVQSDAAATAQAIPTATAQALAVRYKRAAGLVNLQRWVAAQVELQAIFDIDPAYKDVQILLATVNAEATLLPPTATWTPSPTPTITPTPRPTLTPRGILTPTPTVPLATADATGTAAAATVSAFLSATPTPTRAAASTPNVTATTLVTTAQAIGTRTAQVKTELVATAQAIATTQAIATVQAANPPRTNAKDGAVYLYVPAGEFLMGSTDTDTNAADDEKPQHTVYLDSFWVMQTEVTNAKYGRCVTAGACTAPANKRWQESSYADHPVVNVNWKQAQSYCAWAGGRLPTEAEWEKAARGTDGWIYPWGNEAPDAQRANFSNNVRDTTPVGSYHAGASRYGALDMAGNVWEWTASLYKPYPDNRADSREDPISTDVLALRGGAWDNYQLHVRVAARYRNYPGFTNGSFGFRCARSP